MIYDRSNLRYSHSFKEKNADLASNGEREKGLNRILRKRTKHSPSHLMHNKFQYKSEKMFCTNINKQNDLVLTNAKQIEVKNTINQNSIRSQINVLIPT